MRIPLLAAMAMSLCRVASAQLYGVDTVGDNRLFTIDRDTAKVSLVGSAGSPGPFTGLAYDPNTDTLYALCPADDSLYVIDRWMGSAIKIGPLGGNFKDANGLAFDPIDKILYATDKQTESLITIDPNTGAATLVGKMTGGFVEIEGLGYDPANRVLYGLTRIFLRIVTIDVDSALCTGVGDRLPNLAWRGLEYDAGRKRLYLCSGTELYEFSPVTGKATPVGTMAVGFMHGLAAVSAPCYADCDGSGTLDIDDFICFQSAFGLGQESADCDWNGTLDIDDFICYQTAYGVGCG